MYELWKKGALDFGALLLEVYQELGLGEAEYVFFVLLARALKGNPQSWKLADLAANMSIEESGVAALFMEAIGKGFVEVSQKSDEEGRRFEEYSLLPLFGKMDVAWKQKQRKSNENSRQELFKVLEQDFGLLSSKDIETAYMWLDDDGFDPEVIKLAVVEMKSQNITSIKYVDKILLEWKRKNVRTVEEAKRQMIDFRNRKAHLAPVPATTTTVNPDDYYDWMSDI